MNLVYQYWIHTETIGRMHRAGSKRLMNTPSHHRVHHATNPRYLDANFAGVFIIWDRMFGTFVPELDSDKPIYGIGEAASAHSTRSSSPIASSAACCATAGETACVPGAGSAASSNKPGWSPDGRHSRSQELKEAYLAAHPGTGGHAGPAAQTSEGSSDKSCRRSR